MPARLYTNNPSNIGAARFYNSAAYTGSICVSGAGGANGTYTFGGYYTQNGYTRPIYNSPTNQYQISILYTVEGRYGLWDNSGDGTLLYEGNTFPPPSNPYLETSWNGPITVTSGSC